MARAVINVSCEPQVAIKLTEIAKRLKRTESQICVEALKEFFSKENPKANHNHEKNEAAEN